MNYAPRFAWMVALAAACCGVWAAPAAAQNYRFAVPAMDMEVYPQRDASVRIVYTITFENAPGASPIDIVDIGTLGPGYRLDEVHAEINGQRCEVQPSTVVSPGFEVHLGYDAIQPGAKGTVHVEYRMPNAVFQDTTRSDYASLRVTPTWFDGNFLTGTTHLRVALHIPGSVKPDEVLHQGENFTGKALTKDGVTVLWAWPQAQLSGPHLVGASFPKRDFDRVVTMTRWDLLLQWFEYSTDARIWAGVIFLALFGWSFFRFTGGTGLSVYCVLLAGAAVAFVVSPAAQLLSVPAVVGLVALVEWMLGRRKRNYLPPIMQVEGGGIKRGLTAPEAASLLELPPPKVLMLVIFGMLKKGLVRQTAADPLTVEPAPEFVAPKDASDAQAYRQAAQKLGIVLQPYECAFLWLIQQNPGKPLKDIQFSSALKELFSGVSLRLKGFDVIQTQTYYRGIVQKAIQQASAVGDIQQKTDSLDRNFDWILMDDRYPQVFGPEYRPVWTRGGTFPTTTAGGGPVLAEMLEPAGRPSGQPTLGDVAGSFAGWTESTMGKLASTIVPGQLGSAPAGGFLDLSGADTVTGGILDALTSSSGDGGGGGGGGGCACACAGCACACACAGGGR